MHPDDKKLAKLTRTDIKVLINRFAQYDMVKLQAVLQDKTQPVLHHMIGRIFLMAIKEGDYRRMDAMLDRLIGRVREEKVVTFNVAEMSDRQLLEAADEAKRVIEAELLEDNNAETKETSE